jgi:hypothetical protein
MSDKTEGAPTQDLLAAKDPQTPPERLAELSKSENQEIKAAVAENPNTPMKTLWRLGEYFPAELLKNPMLALLPLENPNFLLDISIYTFVKMAYHPDCPSWIYESAASVATLRHFIATNPRTPPTILETLVNESEDHIRIALAKNPNSSPTLLANLAKDESISVLVSLAKNPNTPLELLAALATHEDSEVQAGVAQNVETTPEILSSLSSGDRLVRACIAAHSKASIPLLEQLSKDPNSDVRVNVAENPNTPIEVLAYLAQDEGDTEQITNRATEGYWVRVAVAHNPNTPVPILSELAMDKAPSVRAAAAINPSTLESVRLILTKDQSSEAQADARSYLRLKKKAP